jgi:hypothetical protein
VDFLIVGALVQMTNAPVVNCPPTGTVLKAAIEVVKNLNAQIAALQAQVSAQNSALAQKYQEALLAQYSENIDLMKVVVHIYKWQLNASTILLWTVIVVVASGVILSAVQMLTATKLDQSSFEASFKSIKITSSIVGLLVLAMSLGLLLIFVRYVYKIEPVSVQPVPITVQASPRQ